MPSNKKNRSAAQVCCQKVDKDHRKNVKNAITNNQDHSKNKVNELLFDQQIKQQDDNDEKQAEENINQLEPSQPKPNNGVGYNSKEKCVNGDIDKQKVHDGKANDNNEGWIKPTPRIKKQNRENVNHKEQPKNESNQEKQQSSDDSKIKHNLKTVDNQNNQKQIPDFNSKNDCIPVHVSTNLGIQRKETWNEVEAKPKKKQEPKIRFFCLPDVDSAEMNTSNVFLNEAGTKFQQNVADALPRLLAGGELILVLSEIGIAQSDNTYTTDIPLIEEHKEILPSIWETIRDQHIVTSGRTLRAFGENLGSSEYTLKKQIIHGKEIYILNYDRGSSTKLDDLQRRVYATIIQNIHNGTYSTYSYSTLKKFKYHIHFSSEEDVLENKEYYEVKTLHETKYPDHRPPPNMAYHIAIQCLSRQSKKVLIGFYNETHVTLKLFTLEKLIHIAKEGKKNVQSAENMMNYNLEQIIDYIKRNGSNMLHKVIIKKADNKNRMNFYVEK